MHARPLALLALVSLVACDPEEAPPEETPAVTCGPGQVGFAGTLNGSPVSELHDFTPPHTFVNGEGGDGRISFLGPDGTLEITFDQLLTRDGTVPAEIAIAFSQPTSTLVGSCQPPVPQSEVSLDGDGNGGTFVLRGMRELVQGGCGDPVEGELSGCFRWQ